MSDHTRANQQLQFTFPANTEEYAPWVATYGLLAPYGECQCGCGQPAPVRKKTASDRGHIKGQPAQYIHGHNARPFDDAPSGYKTCSGCNEVKPLEDFYLFATGRRDSTCKQCSRLAAMAAYFANVEEMRQRNIEYHRANADKLAARERERRADPVYREKCSIELKEWRERNKEYVAEYNRSLQVKARNRVNKLILSGKLPRPDTLICAHCQEVMAAEYHHFNGYEREYWLDVVALCTICHGKAHRKEP